jgi:hypothetical protein
MVYFSSGSMEKIDDIHLVVLAICKALLNVISVGESEV